MMITIIYIYIYIYIKLYIYIYIYMYTSAKAACRIWDQRRSEKRAGRLRARRELCSGPPPARSDGN